MLLFPKDKNPKHIPIHTNTKAKQCLWLTLCHHTDSMRFCDTWALGASANKLTKNKVVLHGWYTLEWLYEHLKSHLVWTAVWNFRSRLCITRYHWCYHWVGYFLVNIKFSFIATGAMWVKILVQGNNNTKAHWTFHLTGAQDHLHCSYDAYIQTNTQLSKYTCNQKKTSAKSLGVSMFTVTCDGHEVDGNKLCS